MQVFLIAKHWQLFILMVIPLVSLRLFAGQFSSFQLSIMLALLLAAVCGWWYAIGVAANEKLEEPLKGNILYFKIALIVPVAYIAFMFLVLSPSQAGGEAARQVSQWVGFLYIGAMLSLYYALWFVARQFVSLRKKERAVYSEYAFTMLGFLIAVLGVWFIQPDVNKLLGEPKGPETSD